MKPQYKFVKPAEPASFTADYDDYITRFNVIGARAWLGKAKDKIGFKRGDIKKRDEIKNKIKEQLSISQEEYCYYCGRSFDFYGPQDTQLSSIHIDHFLPRNDEGGNYGKYVFEMKNLVLACFTCNKFDVKGNKDFSLNPNSPYPDMAFSIVHPHLENINDHLLINEENGVVEMINENTDKAELMISTFGINHEFIVLNRLGSIEAIKKQLKKKQEDEIDSFMESIPIGGIVSKNII